MIIALVITLYIICQHFSQENTVSDKTVQFIVDLMILGFPEYSVTSMANPQPGGPEYWISGVPSLDVLSSKTTDLIFRIVV